jgi:thioredoxin reductase (NADPH)
MLFQTLKPLVKFCKSISNVTIIGSGPAGHTAAIYAARAALEPLMFEGFMAGGIAAGGQLTTTTDVENFPGFPEGIMGLPLTNLFREQSLNFGTVIHTETISKVDLTEVGNYRLETEDGEEHFTKSIIIATGATAKRMFIKGEDTYWQKGISACAVCDGAAPIFRNKNIGVVGGGDSACEEAMFLTKYASKVYLFVRRDKLRASNIMQQRVLKNKKIEIMFQKAPIEAKGEKLLKKIVLKDTVTGDLSELDLSGLFYAIGHKPNTDLFKNTALELDQDGYVITEGKTSLTNLPGVFAAGDVQDKIYRQAITAAGSGCMAALDCEKYLEALE